MYLYRNTHIITCLPFAIYDLIINKMITAQRYKNIGNILFCGNICFTTLARNYLQEIQSPNKMTEHRTFCGQRVVYSGSIYTGQLQSYYRLCDYYIFHIFIISYYF